MTEIVPVVIVNWNEEKFLGNCLQSLLDMKHSCKKNNIIAKIIIVDNGSSDTSFKIINDFIIKNNNNVTFEAIWEPENLGFVRSTNLGIKHGLKKSSVKFIATLNPDTIVEPNWLSALYIYAKTSKKKEKIGMFASKIKILDITNDETKTECPYNYGHSYRKDGACFDITPKYNYKLFCHCHAGALLNRKMLEECGLIDEDYWGFYDCPNLGWKARLHGWSPVFIPDAKMWHRKSETRRRPKIRKIVERNRVLTILRFLPKEKQHLAINMYLNRPRCDGTTYTEKLQAIIEAKKLFRGEYEADPDMREYIYENFCFSRD